MKTLLLLALFSTSLLAQAKYDVLIITSDNTFGPVIGFTDSSFNYKENDSVKERKFCYSGNISKVCKKIEDFAYNMSMEYGQGNHDNMKMISCETTYGDHGSDEFVTASYELSDDYGSEFTVTRKISACTKSRFSK